MKNIFKILSFLFIATIAFTACETEDISIPVIDYVRPTEAAASDSLLVSASMGQTIAIIGKDLHNVTSIYFNDQKAKLNPTYVTSTSIIVTIPGSIPTEVTNTVTFHTSNDKTVVYDFATKITPPTITSITCEWAMDETEVTISGAYFFPTATGDIEVMFPGNLTGSVVDFSDTEIKVVVPSGALQGFITVTNDYGKGKSPFIFRDNTGIFIDAENPAAWNGWGLSDFATEEGIDGAYIKFEGTTGSWAWPANAIQMLYLGSAALLSDGEVADYALKFECYVHEWHDTPMLIWFDNEGNHNVDGSNAQYHWKPYDNNGVAENFTTDGWITITMPLADFVFSKDESETDRTIASLNELQNLNIMWFGAANGATTEFGLKMWIDNLRLVTVN